VRRLLSVIVAALLSAQAQDGGWYSGEHGEWGSGQHDPWGSGGLTEDDDVVGVPQVVESGQHTQWGSLRYPVRPGQYTVIGELIEGGGVVGIPRVDNPNPQVLAEQVRESIVRYTPSRDPGRPPEGGSGEPLILRDPDTLRPLAYFNNEQEARYYLGDRFYNDLSSRGHLVVDSPGGLPHYSSCYSEDCREIRVAAEEFRAVERSNAERALEGFLETVREVAQAIADFVRDIVQAVVDFFAGLFGDWVQNAVNDIVADTGNSPNNDSGNSPNNGSDNSPSDGSWVFPDFE